jgi:DNA-binding transcriptional ArsR family regulator
MTTAVEVLDALVQESRLAIFRLLLQHAPGGLSAGAIAEQLAVPNATLSFHLKELSRAGLLRARQEGRFIYYAPEIGRMNELIAFLTENCCSGQACGVAVRGPACDTASTGQGSATRTRRRPALRWFSCGAA